mgnify:CR=1 FL=1
MLTLNIQLYVHFNGDGGMRHRKRLHRRELKRRRNVVVIGLLALLLCFTIGYGAFSTNVELSAKGNINTTSDSCFTVSDNGDGTGTITDYDVNTCGTKVKIPSNISGLTITKIGDVSSTTDTKLFSRKNIEILIFPETITYIGSNCCINLNKASINIPNKVKHIGSHAFAWGSIKSITLPEGLETIDVGAFEANDITYLKIPSTVKNLNTTFASANLIEGDDAFIYARDKNGSIDNTTLISFGNRSRKEVVIPSNVKEIVSAAFVSDWGIEKVIIPDSVTTIYGYAFWSMDHLNEVNIGNGITFISSNAFSNVPKLTIININRKENAVKSAPWGATNATINWLDVN